MGLPSNIDASTESGTALATHFNELKTAVASQNKGTSRDANLVQGGIWVDSTDIGSGTAVVKFFDGTDDITLFTIDISANTVTLPSATNSLSISKISADAVAPIMNFVKSRIASSGQVNSGDSLGEIIVGGKDNTGTTRNALQLKVAALENFTSTANGAEFILNLIKATESAYTEILRIKNGLIGIGTSSPSAAVHVKSSTGIYNETLSADNATAAKTTYRKKRSSTNGKVLSGDGLGTIAFHSTDQNGTEITDAANIEAVAQQDHVNTAHGTKLDFYVKKAGATSRTKQMTIGDTLAVNTLLDISAATAGGIKFPSTQNPDSNVNTLDDYEEGTFTPTFYGIPTAGVTTYSTQNGTYTKIGNMVFYTLRMQWTNATGSGACRIGGLPFTTTNSVTGNAGVSAVFLDNYNLGAGLEVNNAYIIPNDTAHTLYTVPVGGGASNNVGIDVSATVIITGFYRVD